MESLPKNLALDKHFCVRYDGDDGAIRDLLEKYYDLRDRYGVVSVVHTLPPIKESLYVVLIGPRDADAILKAMEWGVDRYIPEPVDERYLVKVIEDLKKRFYLHSLKEHQLYMLQQYKEAIDRANIVSKTDKNGIITYVNEEFCKISGYGRKELVGKNHNIVRHPDVPKERFRRFWETILAKKIWKGTVKNRAKDGSTFYVNTTVVPITDYGGEIVEFVAIRYDVTESVKLQEKLKKKEYELEELNKDLEWRVEEATAQLKELNASLEERIRQEVAKNRQKDRVMFQQAKLASLGEMLGNIAHQWRQPLMELSILLYKIKKGKNIEEVYERGNAIVERMNQTIVDFQDFFRPDRQPERFAVVQAVSQTLSIMEGSLKKEHIEVTLEAEREYEIFGFKNEFSQVMLNLLSNAKEILRKKDGERKIEISIKKVEGSVWVEVLDNGGGIEETIMDRVFEPYFTTKGEGTGLGLYMSRMIIEKSGGKLEVVNKDKGALFRIIFDGEEDV
jgi:PAS domain S-box-containing protein